MSDALGPAPSPTARPGPAQAAGEGFSMPSLNIDGLSFAGAYPPDTNGDVGPHHYIQAVNFRFQVFDKSGSPLTTAASVSSLWKSSGDTGVCSTHDNGDAVVLYDHLADRWLVTQLARADGLSYECMAVSRSGDPVAGGWYVYAFGVADGFEYPKLGVWPDGYYMSALSDSGTDAYAIDRANMLSGNPATLQRLPIDSSILFVLPSDLDGPAPPAGTPNVFARHVDGGRWGGMDRIELFAFTVNWADPTRSGIRKLPALPVEPFSADLCGGTSSFSDECVPQPGTPALLDTLPNWPMFPMQYRVLNGHDTLSFDCTVDVGSNRAGIRWYQLQRASGGTWSVLQQGTYGPPDDVHRWMGSVGIDTAGDLALGYSASAPDLSPGVRYAGRLATDPVGSLPEGEVVLIDGSTSQTNSGRWGDYSAMRVDPADGCTFWFTTEYMPPSGAWTTRIGAFSFPACFSTTSTTTGPTTTSASSTSTTARTTTSMTKPSATTSSTAPAPCTALGATRRQFNASIDRAEQSLRSSVSKSALAQAIGRMEAARSQGDAQLDAALATCAPPA